MSAPRLQRVALPVAAIASLAIMVGLLSDAAAVICLVLVVLCTVITAPARRQQRGGWWNLLALGALISLAGAAIALGADTIGGLVAAAGGVLVVVAATIGFPAAD